MSVTSIRRYPSRLAPLPPLGAKRVQKKRYMAKKVVPDWVAFSSAFRASLAGAVETALLLAASFIPLDYLSWVVVPGFMVVFISSGMLACIYTEDKIRITGCKRGGEIGWMAGFWTGIHGGVMVMGLAALEIFMKDFGQGVVRQLTAEQLELLLSYGFDESLIALTARVLGALWLYGLVGALTAALFGAVGGMLYVTAFYSANNEVQSSTRWAKFRH